MGLIPLNSQSRKTERYIIPRVLSKGSYQKGRHSIIINYLKYTLLPYWFYLLKHMSKMEKMPKFLDKRVFKLIFKIGEVSKLKKEERMAYEASLKAKWDTQNAFDYAIKEAAEEAKKKTQEEERSKAEAEKLISAGSLKKLGVLTNQQIAESLKLPLEVVEKL